MSKSTFLFSNLKPYFISCRLKREEFQQAANEISKLFPGEEPETYYIPYSSVSKGLRIPARGKLWSRYINVKAALRLSNSQLIKSTPEQKNEEKNEETENELIFLRTAVEPYSRIIKSWDMTYQLRYQQYIRNKNQDNLFDIFPSLRQRYGLELVSNTFLLKIDNFTSIYLRYFKILLKLKNWKLLKALCHIHIKIYKTVSLV